MSEKERSGNLKFPWRREELKSYLVELSNPQLQRALWGEGNSSALDDIDAVFHFFFDDTDFGSDASNEIGLSLLNLDEALAISALVEKLEWMLKKKGDVSSSAFIDDPGWIAVVDKAGLALAALS